MAVVLTTDQENRLAFKRDLLDKVEHALTPPTFEPDPEPVTVEIIQKYADVPFTVSRTDARLFRSLDPVPAPLGVDEDLPFVLDSDAPKRAAFKQNLLHKVAETLTPVTEPQPAVVEIIDSYSPWRVFEPTETLDPGLKAEKPFILDRDVPKRSAFKDSLKSKVADALTPIAPEPEPAPIEIIEKYARGTQRPGSPVETIDPGFEANRPILVPDGFLHSDIPRREAFKQSLLHKVDNALAPPAPAREEEPITVEIIEKYLGPIPLDPDEMDPEFKRIEPFILDSDVPKREATREALLKKSALTPLVPLPEPAPVEVVGYSQRAPSPLGIEFPEVGARVASPLGIELPEVKEPVPLFDEAVAPVPVFRLPANYRELDEQALYGVLIRTPHLQHSSATANLVLDIITGRTAQAAELIMVEDVQPVAGNLSTEEDRPKGHEIPDQFKIQDHEKRLAQAAQLAEKIRNASAKSPVAGTEPENVIHLDFDIPEDWRDAPPTVLRAELLAQGATPEQADTFLSQWIIAPITPHQEPLVMARELLVELPTDFRSLRAADKYAYLTKHALLAPDDANDAIAALDSKPQHGARSFIFSFADIIDPEKRQERKEYLAEKASAEMQITPGIEHPEDAVFLLPTNYTDLSEVDLHYLMAHTPELGYSPERVYQALDILFGRTVQPDHISFKTIELERPVVLGRRDETVSVTKTETSRKPKARSVRQG